MGTQVNSVQEVFSGVFCVDHSVAEGKNGVILGQRGALVIDVGTLPTEGEALAALVRQRGFMPTRVVITHGHSDHVLGGAAFDGAEVFANVLTPSEIQRHLTTYASRKQLDPQVVLAQALWPTITFTDQLLIDLGGRTVRLLPLPGHSRDMIGVYLEAERILFASDTVVTGIAPAIGDGDSRTLESSLQGLLRVAIEILIPGHGHVLFGQAAISDWLRWEIAYLNQIRTSVTGILATNPAADLDEVMSVTTYEQLIGNRLPVDKHGMPTRHRNTVGKILAEERAVLIQES